MAQFKEKTNFSEEKLNLFSGFFYWNLKRIEKCSIKKLQEFSKRKLLFNNLFLIFICNLFMIEGSPLRLNISSTMYSTPLKNTKRTMSYLSQSERKSIVNEKIIPNFSRYMSPKLSSLFKDLEIEQGFASYTYSGSKKSGIPHGHGLLLTPANTIIYVGEFYLGKFWGKGILKNPQPFSEENENTENLENIGIENNLKTNEKIENHSKFSSENNKITCNKKNEIEQNDKNNQFHRYMNETENTCEKSDQNKKEEMFKNNPKQDNNGKISQENSDNFFLSLLNEETTGISDHFSTKTEKIYHTKIEKKLVTENDENYFETMDGKKIMKSWLEYEGHFIDGCFSGRGLVRLTNGDTFCGGFLKGEIDGWGIYLKKEEGRFIGEWRRGKLKEVL